MNRKITKQINVGGVAVGGGAPVSIQSMLNCRTKDAEACLKQIDSLKNEGCDIIRLAVPDMDSALALKDICRDSPLPVVADIHFDYKLALMAASAGCAKIRINPGNIGSKDRVRAVADACRAAGIPIRIGVNGGSLEKQLLKKYGGVCAEAMVESAEGHVRLLEDCGFDDICLSLKASEVPLTVSAYRLASEKFNYPLHVGVTEAGTEYGGIIASAAGIGALLCEGIGDTIRVSLTAEPEREVKAAKELLRSLGLRKNGVHITSCPTCGRTEINLIETAKRAEEILSSCKADINVAIMGCIVNGPGEARHCDYGLAGGKGEAVLFKKGEIVAKVPEEQMLGGLIELIRRDGIEI